MLSSKEGKWAGLEPLEGLLRGAALTPAQIAARLGVRARACRATCRSRRSAGRTARRGSERQTRAVPPVMVAVSGSAVANLLSNSSPRCYHLFTPPVLCSSEGGNP
jgi:hypothetical protein